MKTSYSAERIRLVTWLVVMAAIGATCLATTWNALALSFEGSSLLSIGRPLVDEEEPSAPAFDRQRFASHEYQIQFQRFAMQSVPQRPILVRLHNEILYSVFNTSPRPAIVIGGNEYMVGQNLVTLYCQRSLAAYTPRMQTRVAQLRALQEHFRARQRAFLFVITPSKMARMPEKFLSSVACPTAPAEREAIMPTYVRMLGDAGIHFVDAASLMDGLRKSGVTPFPVGGVHWNMLGAAHATNAIIRGLNQTAARPLLPALHWTTHPADGPLFEDDDLVVGLNLLFEPSYPSTHVAFAPSGPCPSGKLSVTLVGTSSVVQLARALSETQCVARGRRFAGLTRKYFTFPPEREVATGPLKPDFVKPLLDADVIILEEHESLAASARHVPAFYNLILGDEPIAQPATPAH